MRIAPAVLALRREKVGAAITELHHAESDLHGALLRLADRHRVDHEIYHVAQDVARWSREHVARLAQIGGGRGLELDPEPSEQSALLSAVRRRGAELAGRHHAPTLLLLTDLRHIHRVTAGVSLDWEVLAQTAQALQDRELLELAQSCHPETLRQLRWSNAKVKDTAAQVMVTG